MLKDHVVRSEDSAVKMEGVSNSQIDIVKVNRMEDKEIELLKCEALYYVHFAF